MEDFTHQEAREKIGRRVEFLKDGAFLRADIKKGMTGQVSAAATSPYIRSEGLLDVWVVYIEFDDPFIPTVTNIHKHEYENELKEL
jgi:hypothetical protein